MSAIQTFSFDQRVLYCSSPTQYSEFFTELDLRRWQGHIYARKFCVCVSHRVGVKATLTVEHAYRTLFSLPLTAMQTIGTVSLGGIYRYDESFLRLHLRWPSGDILPAGFFIDIFLQGYVIPPSMQYIDIVPKLADASVVCLDESAPDPVEYPKSVDTKPLSPLKMVTGRRLLFEED